MVSPELIRRYPFFAGLSHEEIAVLASYGEELSVPENYFFFGEGEHIEHFYLVVQGAVGIVIWIPRQDTVHSVSQQYTREYETEEVIVSAVGQGEIFGWSGLVPPHNTVAGAKALTSCRVISFDCPALLKAFETDCRFGYLMMEKIAQVIRERLRSLRIESLTRIMETPTAEPAP